ncbi:MAG: DUF58 domain-containing protein [Planctomycetota bacterium]
MAEENRPTLDPHVLAKIERLEVRARLVVEGFLSGMHRSPFKGSSLEFAQHREYAPGDDVRFVDWKLLAKTDGVYVQEFEEETNLRCYLFVDQSESMGYAHDGGMSKFDYSATAASSLAYLLQQQSDAVGLALFDEGVVQQIPASNTRGALVQILHQLETAKPDRKTTIGKTLVELASQIRGRSIVCLFSDLFDDLEAFEQGLRALASRGHDVVVFHVLDRDEVEFPFERMTMFEGLESLPQLLADPRGLRDAYLKEVADFQEGVRRSCSRNRVDYIPLKNSDPLDVALSQFLAARLSRKKSARR